MATAHHALGVHQGEEEEDKNPESCCNGRFLKHEDLISKSQYRTIFRGYDNESGCEIAWNVYSLENVEHSDREKIQQILKHVKTLKHSNILTCIYYFMKDTELVMITELITAGSIREYLKKIKLPRLGVIKKWARKILEGVHYLHSQNFIHGKLTCESIYINSNNGDIKIGDIGIRAIPCYNNKYSELSMCKLLKNSEETTKLDIFCFGLSLLEMISSDISGTHAFKVLCKIINKGGAMQVLSSIEDEQLRDMISRALEQEPDKRATLDELLAHSFLVKAENDHNPVPPCLQLTEVIKKYSSQRRIHNRLSSNMHQQSSSGLNSMVSSMFISSGIPLRDVNESSMPGVGGLQNFKVDNNRMKEKIRERLGIAQPSTPQVLSTLSEYEGGGTQSDSKTVHRKNHLNDQTPRSYLTNSITPPDDSATSFTKQMNRVSAKHNQLQHQVSNKQHKPSNFQPKKGRGPAAQVDDDFSGRYQGSDLSPHVNCISQTTITTGASPQIRQIPLTSQALLVTEPYQQEGRHPNQSQSNNLQQQTNELSLPTQQAPKPPRVILMKMKVVNKQKLLEVRFSYDLDKDTPEGVVDEMKHDLELKEDLQVNILKQQIQMIVERFYNMAQVDVTHATAIVPGASNASQANSGGATNNRTQRFESLGSQEANLRQPDSAAQEVAQNPEPIQPDAQEGQEKLQDEQCQDQSRNAMEQQEPNETSAEKDEGDIESPGEEEAIIIDERGGAQEHHNQTMDEAYHHQNTKDEEGKKGQMIQCNVFNNPVNFVNSMILHDKNDLNDLQCLDHAHGDKDVSMKVDLSDKQRWKEEMENTLKQKKPDHPTHHQHVPAPSPIINLIDLDIDDSSDIIYELLCKEESTVNILKDLFPGYSENYWHEHSIRNHQQIQKASSQHAMAPNLNDTLDLSHCSHSCPYLHMSSTISVDQNITAGKDLGLTPSHHHHHAHFPIKREKNANPPPFLADDISIILHQNGAKVSSIEETKNDTHNLDHNHECCYFFTEGMSSCLNFNFNLTINQPQPFVFLNNYPQLGGGGGGGGLGGNHNLHSAINSGGGLQQVSSALGQGQPSPIIALGTSPSLNTGTNQAVSQIGISSQRLHLNVSSNNDSLARMKLKNSMREVLRLGKEDRKRKAAIMEKDAATPKAASSLGANADGHDLSKVGELHQMVQLKDIGNISLSGEESTPNNDKSELNKLLENKNSDIYNAEDGSYFNQKCLNGQQSNGDPTYDGILSTPYFMTPKTSLHPSNHLHLGSESQVNPNPTHEIIPESVLSVDLHTTVKPQQSSANLESDQLLISKQGSLPNTDYQLSSDTLAQTQNLKFNQLYVFPIGDKAQEEAFTEKCYYPPLLQKTKSSIVESTRINLTMIKQAASNGGKQKSYRDLNQCRCQEIDLPPPLSICHQVSDPILKKRRYNQKNQTVMHKSSHEVNAHYNLSFEEVKTQTQELKNCQQDQECELKEALPLSADGNGYFHFNNQYSHQNHQSTTNLQQQQQQQQIDGASVCQHNIMFQQATMKSDKLQRKHREMYKSDITTMQKALKKIFGHGIDIGKKGHYCHETCEYVKKFQEMYNYTVMDGVVDRPLFMVIMYEALRAPCGEGHHETPENISTDYQNITYGTGGQVPSSSTSTFDQQSLASIPSPGHTVQLENVQGSLTPAGTFPAANLSSDAALAGFGAAFIIVDQDTPMPITLVDEDNFGGHVQASHHDQQHLVEQVDQIDIENDEIRILTNKGKRQSH